MIVLWILAALIALCALAGAAVFSAAFTRGAWPLKYFVSDDSLGLGEWEAVINENTAAGRAIPHEDVWITSFDGLRLHGYWVPAEGAERTVLCVHGFHGEAFRDFSGAVPYLHSHGSNALVIDQRAHGQSEGKYITFGALEKYDVQAWARYLAGRMGPGHPMYLDGISMGAATVLWTLGLELPECFRGAIADCGYTSIPEILTCQIRALLKVPAWPILPFTWLFARVFARFDLRADSSRSALRDNRRPVLVAHGQADNLVPFAMGRENARLARCEDPVFAPGAGHGLSFFYARDEYLAKIQALFDACEKN